LLLFFSETWHYWNHFIKGNDFGFFGFYFLFLYLVLSIFFGQVFGAAFKACLENRQRLQKEAGKDPVDVTMIDLPSGGFTREGTFR